MIRRLALVPLLAASTALAAAEPRFSIPTANGAVALSLVVDGFALPAAAGLPPSVRQLGMLSGHRRVGLAQAGDPDLPRLERQARALEGQVGAPVLALARFSPRSQPLIVTRELVLRLHPGVDPVRVLVGEDAVVRGPHPSLARAWVVTANGGLLAAVDCAARLAARPGVAFAEPVVHQALAHRDDPSGSPLYGPAAGGVPSEQWHLNPALGGTHIDVQPVWNFAAGSNLGAGAVLNVVDDGVDAHPGFGANLVSAWGYSYRTNTAAITLTAGDRHGTVVAGLAAARDGTGFGLGVAPRATLVPVQQADALYDSAGIGHNLAAAETARRPWVVNCSWGPSDDGSTWAPMSLTFQAVLNEAVTGGRSGRGVVYCVAAGNGRASGDNANYDEWAIGPQTIGVGATTKTGVQASYSEDAVGLLVCAPGGDSDDVSTGVYCAPADRGGMATIDRVGAAGYVAGDYSVTANLSMRGTSFATPVVAGAASLILAAHPELGYRDLLHLLANHSQRVDAADAGVGDAGRRWQRNNPGGAVRRWHSVRYGFGCVDVAKAMGAVAAGWVPVPALITQNRGGGSAFTVAGGTSASRTLALTTPTAGALVAEHITLEVQFTVAQRRALTFRLASPAGSVSYIQGRSTDFEAATGSETYRFTSVVHWGENPAGSWTLNVDNSGLGQAQIASWALAVNGYHPYPVPDDASVFPATFAVPASGSVSLRVTSAGAERSGTGAVATRAVVDGSAVTVAWDDGSHALVTIPVALLGQGGHSLVLRNGVFDSQFTGTPGSYGTVAWVDGAAIPLTVVGSASVPATPVISAPGAGATVASRRPAISGTTAAGATVRIYEGSILLGTASVTGTAWSFTPTSDLALGSHDLTVFASDGSGATGQPAEVVFTVTDPPVLPVVPIPTVTTTTQQLLIAQAMQSSSSGGGCGLGGMGALVAALALLLTARRRPR
jgi:subtilisin-like proprotein convertase family protein